MVSLSPEYQVFKEENPDNVTQADLVVGLLAHDNEATIDKVAVKVSEGQALDYPGLKTALVLSDHHSQDQTLAAFFAAATGPPKLAVVCHKDENQALQAIFNLLFVAARLKAKTVVVLNADTLTTKRTWLKRLIQPLIQGMADFTNPLYSRNAIDAPVTNLVIYPIFRALFGRRLRQPILTDWAFTHEVLEALLAFRDWPDLPGVLIPELMVKALAVAKDFRICQSIMIEGRYGLSNKRMDTPHITGLFSELTRGVFEAMTRFQDYWPKIVRSKPTSVIGTDLKPGLFPSRYEVRLEELFGEIHELIKNSEPEWRELLAGAPGDLRNYLLNVSLGDLEIDARMWGSLLFYCGDLYGQLDGTAQVRLLKAITPVFLARFLTFQKQTLGLAPTQVESKVEEGADIVEKLKRELYGHLA
ncbi:MAG: hypothetical protein LBI10_11605 [Deltaproteobacteria bacterium]|jgi:hypothetical protein|nr:hypothetical protein [Deltaproteobacteria bacterium]